MYTCTVHDTQCTCIWTCTLNAVDTCTKCTCTCTFHEIFHHISQYIQIELMHLTTAAKDFIKYAVPLKVRVLMWDAH